MENFILSPLSLEKLESLIFNQVYRAMSEFNPKSSDPVKEELLTIAHVADMLSVTVPTVYGYVHQRSIPCMKRRGRLYFSKMEILEWVKSSRRSTADEIKAEAISSLAFRGKKMDKSSSKPGKGKAMDRSSAQTR